MIKCVSRKPDRVIYVKILRENGRNVKQKGNKILQRVIEHKKKQRKRGTIERLQINNT
jgi:hypothetical protein